MILGVALAIARPIAPLFGVLLAIGGVLFPIGRISVIPWALVACDLVLGAAFALIGWQILRRPIPGDAPEIDRLVQPALGHQ